MSLLNNQIQIPELTRAELIEEMRPLLYAPNRLVEMIYTMWRDNFDILHRDPVLRPQKLQILGNYAVELFELNNLLTQFMITILTGKRDDIVQDINNRLASLPEFYFHPDGTVTEIIN